MGLLTIEFVPVSIKDIDVELDLNQPESNDSDSSEEKLDQYFLEAVKKVTSSLKIAIDTSNRYVYILIINTS